MHCSYNFFATVCRGCWRGFVRIGVVGLVGRSPLRYLRETAALDLDPDPNSAGGVRIAGLGGLWQAVVLGFGRLDLLGDTLGV
jgi:hypothetical protein